MSEVDTSVEATGRADGSTESVESTEPAAVTARDHRRAVEDMKRYKAEAAELKAQLDAFQTDKLKEQKNFEALYQAEVEKREALALAHDSLNLQIQNNTKLEAFTHAAGPLAAPEYAQLLDLSQIKLTDEGTIDETSLAAYANSFRQKFHHLLAPSKGANMPSKAPPAGTAVPTKPLEGSGAAAFETVSANNGGTLFKRIGVDRK